MSSAHRPTWTPAMGKDARMNTKQYSSRDIAAHTKLKYRQPGQNNKDDIGRRDLRLELERAERESEAKRRRMAGLLPIKNNEHKEHGGRPTELIEEGEESSSAAKRRKILEDALLADKDDSSSDDDANSNDGRTQSNRNGKSKAASGTLSNKNGTDNAGTNGTNDDAKTDEQSDDDDDDDDDSDDDESETAELLRELEKIKRERAEEKERQERESAANSAISKEAQAATGNPLLNLKAALNQTGNTSPTNSISTSTTTSFSVKRRWDDDVIFKNQARDVNEKPKKEFVNDLLRTEFHRRFLKKFIA